MDATREDGADGGVTDAVAGGDPGIMLDPFSYAADLASAIRGLHGEEPSDPTYAFHTHYIDGLDGTATMELAFDGLRARRDRLTLTVHVMIRPGDRIEVARTTDVALRTVAANGGRTTIRFDVEPDRAYALVGRVGGGATASATGLTIRCRQGPRDASAAAPAATGGFHPRAMANVAALATVHPPRLATPMSQARTAAQFAEPAFADWSARIGLSPVATPDGADAGWELAYLLQVLSVFGVLDARGAGLGFGPASPDLLRMLRDAGCTADAAPAPPPPPEGGDPAEAGYFTRIGLPGPDRLGRHDFLWSTGLSDLLASTEDAIHLVEDSIEYLKPGGLAVHMLSADLRPGLADAGPGARFTRNALGQLALAVVAGRNEVAQLNFHTDDAEAGPVPFGVIVRKG